MEAIRSSDRDPIAALDGSTVLELVGPPSKTAANLSIAEATVPAGEHTTEHYHRTSEEVYVFTSGSGRMQLGEEVFEVGVGDIVPISPCTPHRLWADSAETLVLHCCSSPPYSEADTILCEPR